MSTEFTDRERTNAALNKKLITEHYGFDMSNEHHYVDSDNMLMFLQSAGPVQLMIDLCEPARNEQYIKDMAAKSFKQHEAECAEGGACEVTQELLEFRIKTTLHKIADDCYMDIKVAPKQAQMSVMSELKGFEEFLANKLQELTGESPSTSKGARILSIVPDDEPTPPNAS